MKIQKNNSITEGSSVQTGDPQLLRRYIMDTMTLQWETDFFNNALINNPRLEFTLKFKPYPQFRKI